LNNEFWITYWKALQAFTLFPLCFALMNTFYQWSGRLLVPSGRQSVSALQITTGLPAFNLMVFVYNSLCFLLFRHSCFFYFRPQNLSMQFAFQCLHFKAHIVKTCQNVLHVFQVVFWNLLIFPYAQSKITPRDPTRQSSLWFNKRLTYHNYWTGVCCMIISFEYWFIKPILKATLSKACVCGLSINWIAGPNSAGAWMLVFCDCCVVSGRGLRRDSTYILY
jgi:hypothetical protein